MKWKLAILVSQSTGGVNERWTPKGKELFFRSKHLTPAHGQKVGPKW